MKNKLLLLISAVTLFSCTQGHSPQSVYETCNDCNFSTIIIDSCEYIQGASQLAHKGNCKFCEQRRKAELINLLNKKQSNDK